MQVFLYEYTTARSSLNPAEPLLAEGWAMFQAVRADFERIGGVHVRTLPAGSDDELTFLELAGAADYTLVIAPECDGELLRRCQMVEKSGGRLLGPNSDAVALTGDKWLTYKHLCQCRVPTPPTRTIGALPDEALGFPRVIKPRDGAGSQDTWLIHDHATWQRITPEINSGLVQPFVTGLAASVSFLVGPKFVTALPPAEQMLSSDGCFHYQGGRLPLPEPLDQRATMLAQQAIDAVPGLRGYVGVDLVLGDTSAEDRVIEINPRLTTSYVGLRALCVDNLAKAMLDVVEDRSPKLRWRAGTVVFQADGSIRRI